ncbi:SDR family oxidoreductase [Phytoactinopolyspora limicola]|uniref:SDR family oxidoreductase n=1 Tax=Phytoactinopolyspora limicola TaxID=2715536 RepID=UPI00140B0E15|nr:NAD(P)H-binding protein [Phytoactinopolyspora limicola]
MNETLEPVLVTGATGMLGRAVVARLVAADVPVRALSRRAQPSSENVTWVTGDITTGAGIREAIDGAKNIIHLASAPYRRGYTKDVEIDGTRRLLHEARTAGIQHIIYTSIIGCDQIPWGYFRTKVAAENIVRESPVPFTIARLGQFYEFVDQAFSTLARIGVMVSDRRVVAQPVDTGDVAQRLLTALRDGPNDNSVEFAGPEVLDLRTAAQQWLTSTGKRRPNMPVRIPGKLGKAFRAGHLTTRSEPRGSRTWSDYLKAKYQPSPTM